MGETGTYLLETGMVKVIQRSLKSDCTLQGRSKTVNGVILSVLKLLYSYRLFMVDVEDLMAQVPYRNHYRHPKPQDLFHT